MLATRREGRAQGELRAGRAARGERGSAVRGERVDRDQPCAGIVRALETACAWNRSVPPLPPVRGIPERAADPPARLIPDPRALPRGGDGGR